MKKPIKWIIRIIIALSILAIYSVMLLKAPENYILQKETKAMANSSVNLCESNPQPHWCVR